MKEIKSEDLIVGEVYADVTPVVLEATFLKYEKSDDDADYFTYVSGENFYKADEDGFIAFEKGETYFQ
jgi:hypothetical protein